MDDKPFNMPLVDRRRMRPNIARQSVAYHGPEKPGTIVVDIDERFLYLVAARRQGDPLRRRRRHGRASPGAASPRSAARACGRHGRRPRPWCSLKPELPRYREAGLDNPLGARALYLYQDGRDILFRIHGTNEPWSIGEQVSSGCIRMLNEDVVDLYNRVPIGTTVYVKRNGRYRV